MRIEYGKSRTHEQFATLNSQFWVSEKSGLDNIIYDEGERKIEDGRLKIEDWETHG